MDGPERIIISEEGRHGATVDPWGGVAVKAGGKEALRRYLPFLAIVGLQLVLLARGPTRTVTVSGNAGTGEQVAQGATGGEASGSTGVTAAPGSAGGAGSTAAG